MSRIVAISTGRADLYLLKALEPYGIEVIDAMDFRGRPDMIVLLGDTSKALSIAFLAHMNKIPIAHIHGGEITEGSLDDSMRHAITKLSHLHFTSNEEHRQRVIQMGEHPDRVFNVGSLGADAAARVVPRVGTPYFVVTVHPETLGTDWTPELTLALDAFPHIPPRITQTNDEPGGREIWGRLISYAENVGATLTEPATQAEYLSLCAGAEAVIGNSSSGLIEVPYLGVPTVNIGDRQKGRATFPSVINCPGERGAIVEAIEKALSPEFKKFCRDVKPHSDGKVAERIVQNLKIPPLRKMFYDLPRYRC